MKIIETCDDKFEIRILQSIRQNSKTHEDSHTKQGLPMEEMRETDG